MEERKELINYVNPHGPLPEIDRTKQGALLIIGSASCVWEDLRRYDPLHNGDRMAINNMMAHYVGRLDHGVTIHYDWLPGWGFRQAYLASHVPWEPMATHSGVKRSWVKYAWPLKRDGGTSGLFGVLIALLMGYQKIVLAGMPCDDSPNFCDSPYGKHAQYGRETVHREWLSARDAVFKGRVKSLSGNTAKWLGEP